MAKDDKTSTSFKVPTINTSGMELWGFLMGTYMDANGCDLGFRYNKPQIDDIKLTRLKNATGGETAASIK